MLIWMVKLLLQTIPQNHVQSFVSWLVVPYKIEMKPSH
jgi:hypothetical protein